MTIEPHCHRIPGNHPPKPPFALSVGVVGHRLKRLPHDAAIYAKVEAEVLHALTEIRSEARLAYDGHCDFFAPQAASDVTLSLLTSLAEGADTIAAMAAQTAGYLIDVVLPFEQENYQHDFAGKALDNMKHLQRAARSRLVLPGKRQLPPQPHDAEADKAYEAAALAVVGNCDVLLAIWDGGESGGRGGTTETLKTAAVLGVPIIHVDAGGKHGTRVMWNGLDRFPVAAERLEALSTRSFDAALPQLINELVRLPEEKAERRGLSRHFGQNAPRWNAALAFPLLRTVLGVRGTAWSELRPNSLSALMADFVRPLKPAVCSPPASLSQAYVWADAIGVYFAQVFRSAFVTNFLAASLAVAAALTSLLTDRLWPVAVEIVLIALVVTVTIYGRYRGWHGRWVESREVAERLRVAAMLWVLGTRPRAFSGEEPAWTGWYARAWVRAQPLRSCVFDGPAIESARAATIAILEEQRDYNKSNAHRMAKLEHRLERVGLILFVLTVLIALDHLVLKTEILHAIVHYMSHGEVSAHHVGIAFSAILPTFATATYGIRVIGDFEGIARRSERTFRILDAHIAALRQESLDLDVLRRRARAAGDAMLGDLSSWRLSAESRGLAIPG